MAVSLLDYKGQGTAQAEISHRIRPKIPMVDDFARGFSAPDALKKIDELERALNHKEKWPAGERTYGSFMLLFRDLAASRVELSRFLSEAEDIVQENRYLRQVAKIPLDRLLDLT
ncbi:hypothetical protein FOZ62_017531, partial [Perkinsus olseni]